MPRCARARYVDAVPVASVITKLPHRLFDERRTLVGRAAPPTIGKNGAQVPQVSRAGRQGGDVDSQGVSDMSSAQLYETIGAAYTVTRRTEPRIAARIWAALGDARTVLNVGAGTGSYEPDGRDVTAVEPSALMRAQRPAGAPPCVAAVAESLPFEDQSFDAGCCHRASLAGPDCGPARDAARGTPRGGVHARQQ
jgi:hypothetical protein